MKVYGWLAEYLAQEEGCRAADILQGSRAARKQVRTALVMSLCYCYYARLAHVAREQYVTTVVSAWSRLQLQTGRRVAPTCSWLELSERGVTDIIYDVQMGFVRSMSWDEWNPNPRGHTPANPSLPHSRATQVCLVLAQRG